MDRNIQTEASSQNDEQQKEQRSTSTDAVVDKNVLAHETRQLVRTKARRLVARAGLPRCQLEDIAQSLDQALVRDAKAFDPHKGEWLPFAERVLRFASNNLLRHGFAEKRNHRNTVSLPVTVMIDNWEESAELAQLIAHSELDARTGTTTRNTVEQSDMRLDVAGFKASLSTKLRELADALERETILDISRRAGTPRATLYDRLELLRRAAEDQGLSNYVK
jgi:hypothetical protein